MSARDLQALSKLVSALVEAGSMMSWKGGLLVLFGASLPFAFGVAVLLICLGRADALVQLATLARP